MRKKDENLQKTIFNLAREMADKTGPNSINIRAIANKAGIATGTVYNYYSSKDDILLELTEEYWRKTLLDMDDAIVQERFCDQLREIHSFLSRRIDQSAGKLMSSLGNMETAGRERMQSMQEALSNALVRRMEADSAVRADIWDETFTKRQFARFITAHMIALLQDNSLDSHFFVELVKRMLYE